MNRIYYWSFLAGNFPSLRAGAGGAPFVGAVLESFIPLYHFFGSDM